MRQRPSARGSTFRPISRSGIDEVLLDVARHQPAFLGFGVRRLEAGEIHVGARQGDAGGLLVLEQPCGVDAVDLVEVFVQPPRIVGGFAQHLGQVDVVERQHLADDVEDAVGQHVPHLLELFQQPLKDAAFDDVAGLPRTRWRRS